MLHKADLYHDMPPYGMVYSVSSHGTFYDLPYELLFPDRTNSRNQKFSSNFPSGKEV